MPIDPREIKPGRNQLYELILSDRPCGNCGYNLRGLPSNGRCPECGRAISGVRGRKQFTDNLGDAPASYLKALALGACLMALGWVAYRFSLRWLLERQTVPGAVAAGGSALAWWVGVFIATARRHIGDGTLPDKVLDSVWFRHVNRGVHSLWAVAVVAWVLCIRGTPPASQIAYYAANGLAIVASFGLVTIAVHLACLSDWAGDTGLAERFRISAWALAACQVIAQVGRLSTGFSAGGVPSIAGGFLWFGSIWATLGLAAAHLIFLVSLFQIAHLCIWAIFNSSKSAEVNRRLLEKRRQHEREMASRTAAAAAMNRPVPIPGRLPPKPRPPKA